MGVIEKICEESLRVKRDFIKASSGDLYALAEDIATAFTSDGKLLICGNGGSAADAQHLAAEFINRFEMERPSLPAMALTTDTSILTSVANDYSFESIFSKQIRALGLEGDILIVISTSGNSPNILEALRTAAGQGLYTAALLGSGGGKAVELTERALVVPSTSTARIQEAHILAGHILCYLVDQFLFKGHMKKP